MSHITSIRGLAQQLEDLVSQIFQSDHDQDYQINEWTTQERFYTSRSKQQDHQSQHRIRRQIRFRLIYSQVGKTNLRIRQITSQSGKTKHQLGKNRPREECDYCGKNNHSESTCSRPINAEAGHPDEKSKRKKELTVENYDHSEAVYRKRIGDEKNESKKTSRTVKFTRTKKIEQLLQPSEQVRRL